MTDKERPSGASTPDGSNDLPGEGSNSSQDSAWEAFLNTGGSLRRGQARPEALRRQWDMDYRADRYGSPDIIGRRECFRRLVSDAVDKIGIVSSMPDQPDGLRTAWVWFVGDRSPASQSVSAHGEDLLAIVETTALRIGATVRMIEAPTRPGCAS